jgi:peptide/nickel transport system ATP-binding protein
MTAVPAALEVRGLRAELRSGQRIVDDVSLSVAPGEIVGIVGESGSGKTTTCLALLGYAQSGVRISGEIRLGDDVLALDQPRDWRAIRGRRISYVPQKAGTALNPSMRIGRALAEMLRTHGEGEASGDRVLEMLGVVGLPATPEFARRFPHQLSGGQQQRVCIANALICAPPIIVLDEPTTGLDAITQARILAELTRLRASLGVGMVYVSHDLAVVAQLADRIAVMYAGEVVEQGRTAEVLADPKHPYTRGLIACVPDHRSLRELRPPPRPAHGIDEPTGGCSFAPRCPRRLELCVIDRPPLEPVLPGREVRCFAWNAAAPEERGGSAALAARGAVDDAEAAPLLRVRHLHAEYRSRRDTLVAVQDLSFDVHAGACVALVGESGSGKTTAARAVAGLHPNATGELRLAGEPLSASVRARSVEQRRRVQTIFQSSADALNPSHTVRDAIARPARMLRRLSRTAADAEVERLLDAVRLPRRLAGRYPAELSGGEQQRVSIARALVANPDVLICDEITSALDVSVQAAVLELILELRTELGIGLLFITHNFGVVATVADDVIVLNGGEVCEQAPVDDVLQRARHPYTQQLLAAVPSIDMA